MEQTTNTEQVLSPEAKTAQINAENFEKELSKKLYPLECDDATKEFILTVALEKLQWKGREAIAVAKLHEQLTAAAVKKDGDNSYMFLTGTEMHALNFVLDKYQSNGVECARKFAALMRAVIRTMAAVSADSNQLSQLKYQAEALAQGLEIDVPESAEAETTETAS